MNRIDRLTAILIQLQGKSVITAQEVADRFEISLRTVYRDIRALEEAGVPIGAEAGKGYFIMDGYRLPPVMFTKEEASAILIGAKLLEKKGDESIKNHFNDALHKIRSVLRSSEKGHLESLEQRVRVMHLSTVNKETFPDNFLTDIQNALVQKQVLQFDYYSNYNGQYTTREVEPVGICYYSSSWHLIAYCQLRNDFRDFRLDRLTKLTVTSKVFDKDYSDDYREYFNNMFDMGNVELTETVVRFKKELRRAIVNQKYYHGFVTEKEVGDEIEMAFMSPDIQYFGRWLLAFGTGATVVYPQKLKDFLNGIVEKLQGHYK